MDSQPQRSQTRRRPRKPLPLPPVPPKKNDWLQERWQKMLARGDEFFTYMISNFNSMFINDTFVKHFEINEDSRYNMEIYETDDKDAQNKLLDDIQKELVPWIKNEHKSGRLFENTNWMPFPGGCGCSVYETYLGYRYMFLYKDLYFQLSINEDCIPEECKYCDGNEFNMRFELVFEGQKDESSNKLKPHDHEIGPENTIAAQYWKPY